MGGAAAAQARPHRHSPVGEVEGLSARPVVHLRLDQLGVGVRGQLLAGVPAEQEEGIVLWVGHLELVRAEGADFFGGGVRADQQGFGGAASRVRLLQSDAEVVLRREETASTCCTVWD